MTHGDDGAGRLVSEHERGLDDEFADAAFTVVMRVGPTDPHRGDTDQHITGAGLGNWPFFDLDPPRLHKNCRAHRRGESQFCCVDHTSMLTY